ncbi:hypothetical protein GIB67_004960 [Kingdonia uniflora]|uniref:Uncharacterized protein n=1 Tax=Kingdonia uniflora TaxID=39325 RepID=A0A7J7NNA3_9MAGN|nr:hypothetical protein GIB67_004960 [Kingdonia uniflora]
MKGSNGGSKAQILKDKTKKRVDDLQGVFTNLQSARKGGCGNREGDELTSVLREPAKPKPKPDVQNFRGGASVFQQNYYVNHTTQDQGFQGIDECHGYSSGMQLMNKLEGVNQLDCNQFDFT